MKAISTTKSDLPEVIHTRLCKDSIQIENDVLFVMKAKFKTNNNFISKPGKSIIGNVFSGCSW